MRLWRKKNRTIVHVITPFHDGSAVMGTNMSGWNCTCTVYGFDIESAERHLAEMSRYAALPTVEEVRG